MRACECELCKPTPHGLHAIEYFNLPFATATCVLWMQVLAPFIFSLFTLRFATVPRCVSFALKKNSLISSLSSLPISSSQLAMHDEYSWHKSHHQSELWFYISSLPSSSSVWRTRTISNTFWVWMCATVCCVRLHLQCGKGQQIELFRYTIYIIFGSLCIHAFSSFAFPFFLSICS